MTIDFDSIAYELGMPPKQFCLWGCVGYLTKSGEYFPLACPTYKLVPTLASLYTKHEGILKLELLATNNLTHERSAAFADWKKCFLF